MPNGACGRGVRPRTGRMPGFPNRGINGPGSYRLRLCDEVTQQVNRTATVQGQLRWPNMVPRPCMPHHLMADARRKAGSEHGF
eukprot:872944-Rhodomonas_salina.3